MSDELKKLPRWARTLGKNETETLAAWDRMNELLSGGWENTDVFRECKLPQGKRRSFQLYAQKFGPRRRLMHFARLKDGLLANGATFSKDVLRSLSVIAAMAVSPETDEKVQLRAFEAMARYTEMLARLTQDDAADEETRKATEADGDETLDVDAVVAELYRHYRIRS